MRTTAHPAGDKGRDAELFTVDGDSNTKLQYSVTQDWTTKIRKTAGDLAKNGLRPKYLIYCTNQQIGAAGDDIKSELRGKGIGLDIRDREWFCEREGTSSEGQAASDELCSRVLAPLLSVDGLAERAGSPITAADGRVALVQLALNAEDRQGDRNLTKASFDSLVLASLTDTSAEQSVDEAVVVERVKKLVASGAPIKSGN